ncbi:MAG: hypothetical protein J4400_02030 [Candidatus Aenigmarchaeota archaeon]|nr:hypothetical protein [Candidatus Aenigmarchaeota archaeon]
MQTESQETNLVEELFHEPNATQASLGDMSFIYALAVRSETFPEYMKDIYEAHILACPLCYSADQAVKICEDIDGVLRMH